MSTYTPTGWYRLGSGYMAHARGVVERHKRQAKRNRWTYKATRTATGETRIFDLHKEAKEWVTDDSEA